MNLSDAKATSKLLHALAGDTPLDPVTAAAAIETLSFSAGTVLDLAQILTPTGLQTAVATTTSPTSRPPATTGLGDGQVSS